MFGKLYDKAEEEGAYVYRPNDNFDETNAKSVKKLLEQVADDAAGLERSYEKLVKKQEKQRKNASKTENKIKRSIKKAYGESEPLDGQIKIPAHKGYTIKSKNEYAYKILGESLDNMRDEKYFEYKGWKNIPIGMVGAYGSIVSAILANSWIPLVGLPAAGATVGVLYYKSKKNDARKKMFRELKVVNG
ncbi:MAG: hypothetical protein HZB68_00820 [Candidatus Aenigmarchaeota archaeon]|nr:hypothetical protein [Candidatus Aenigmarchaeota archaeon]